MRSRLAQAVLSREDPQESFLKTVPLDGGYLDVVYPVRAAVISSLYWYHISDIIFYCCCSGRVSRDFDTKKVEIDGKAGKGKT